MVFILHVLVYPGRCAQGEVIFFSLNWLIPCDISYTIDVSV